MRVGSLLKYTYSRGGKCPPITYQNYNLSSWHPQSKTWATHDCEKEIPYSFYGVRIKAMKNTDNLNDPLRQICGRASWLPVG